MLEVRVLNELKKWLRKKRRHVWSLGIGAALFALAALTGGLVAERIVLPALLYEATPAMTPTESPPEQASGAAIPVRLPSYRTAAQADEAFGPRSGAEIARDRFVHCFYQLPVRATETWTPERRSQDKAGDL